MIQEWSEKSIIDCNLIAALPLGLVQHSVGAFIEIAGGFVRFPQLRHAHGNRDVDGDVVHLDIRISNMLLNGFGQLGGILQVNPWQ